MVTITATEFVAMINDRDITATNAEYLLDQAINELNTFGADLSNMSGTAASKTWSGESKEKGAIVHLARAMYDYLYKRGETVSISSLSVAAIAINDVEVANLAKNLAQQLKEIDVSNV